MVKQVRDSDVPDLEPRRPAAQPWLPGSDAAPPPDAASVTAASSPAQEPPLDVDDDNDMMGDLALGLSSSFKQHAMRNSKGKMFWDTFSETSSVGGGRTTTPPPPSVSGMPRAASSNMSEDVGMDSPSQGMAGQRPLPSYFGAAGAAGGTGGAGGAGGSGSGSGGTGTPQTPADITRRINGKRRRDDDWDPASFKRRAVSPSLSVHGSPMPQSPMQPVWGSRPGSNGADRGGSISAASDSGSVAGGGSRGGPAGAGGKRVGLQGMVDTNDGIMRMSIE